jgi:hypothetical protein
MTEAILPFQHPIIAKTIDVNDWVIEKFDKATMDKNYGRPYNFTKTYAYDPDDGLLTGTNDTTDWVMIGPGSANAGNLYGIIDVDFEVTGGNWRVAKWAAIKVYAITKADGTDMGIEGIMGWNSDRTELEPGRYTMSYISFSANAFCDIAPGAKIKMHSMHQHTLHCVANINPRYYCNMQCWDDARQEWWTPLDVNNHETPVVPTFSDAAWRSVPAPALLSQPSFNGQLKGRRQRQGLCRGGCGSYKNLETNQQHIITFMTRTQKIQQLKEELQSTDYIALKAFEGRDVSEHGDWQQRRQDIRDSINALQAMSDDEYYEAFPEEKEEIPEKIDGEVDM